jgi:hypothetical protein
MTDVGLWLPLPEGEGWGEGADLMFKKIIEIRVKLNLLN